MRRFEGKVVLITGAARGQGRSHAVHFAREGANVALCDIGRNMPSVPYRLGSVSELEHTAALVREEGVGAVSAVVDVRDATALESFVDQCLEAFGKVDVAVANAGIFSFLPAHDLTEAMFDDMIAVNLKGVWLTFKAVLPHMRAQKYGRLIAIGSGATLIGFPNAAHYVAAKHGLDGLVKTIALENASEGITANLVCPTHVGTDMIRNQALYDLVSPDDPTEAAAAAVLGSMNAIPQAWLKPEDVSKIVLHVASDDARYTTGSILKVDMGMTAQ